MPMFGGTPADWASQQQGRNDDQIRQVMQMVMAAKEWKENQSRYQDSLQRQAYQDQLEAMRAQAYMESVLNPRPTGDTEMMRNFEFLEGRYPGQDVAGMILPNLKPGSQSEFSYDLDPATAAEIEKWRGLPPGAVSQMGGRARQDIHNAYLGAKFPKADTTGTKQTDDPVYNQRIWLDDKINELISYVGKMRETQDNMLTGLNGVPKRIPAGTYYKRLKTKPPKGEESRMYDNPEWDTYKKSQTQVSNVNGALAKLQSYRGKLAKKVPLTDAELEDAQRIVTQLENIRQEGDGAMAEQIPADVLAAAKMQYPDVSEEEIIRRWQNRNRK